MPVPTGRAASLRVFWTKAGPDMETMTVKVVRKSREAQDIVSFELARADGGGLPPFSAGAHIDVHVGDGLVRQYSLCNDASETHRYLICVLREPASRGGSVAMHDRVREGDLIRISVPKNHFSLVPASKTFLFAGGIGVTPILCMAERLAWIGADFEMHYCTRSVERTAFHERIRSSPFADKVRFYFDDSAVADKIDLAAILRPAPENSHLYVCGPGGFIAFVKDTARKLAWTDDAIHFEYFAAQAAPSREAGLEADFEVQVASTGATYSVPAGASILQVLLENGIDVPASCEQGVCGTCITRVLGGIPDHRDMVFNDAEHARNDQITPCCSRALTPLLVLDL
jgi:vanillate monooxygenase ferredoxin subunit